jgi:hypothetical protein
MSFHTTVCTHIIPHVQATCPSHHNLKILHLYRCHKVRYFLSFYITCKCITLPHKQFLCCTSEMEIHQFFTFETSTTYPTIVTIRHHRPNQHPTNPVIFLYITSKGQDYIEWCHGHSLHSSSLPASLCHAAKQN